MNEVKLVTISANYFNAESVCELIKNQNFESYSDLISFLNTKLNVEAKDIDKPRIFPLDHFCFYSNNNYLNLDNKFVTYVKIRQT